MNEERFQWLATSIRKYGGDASIVHVQGIDNISAPQLIGRFAEARAREYQELIRQVQEFFDTPRAKQAIGRLSRLRSRFQEIVEVDFFESPLQKRVEELLAKADAARLTTHMAETRKINSKDYKNRVWVTRPRPGVDRCASAWPSHLKNKCQGTPYRSICSTRGVLGTAVTTARSRHYRMTLGFATEE
jgi:hypothetical protein